MPGETLNQLIRVTSSTFPKEEIAEILHKPGIYFRHGHFLYPVNDGRKVGNHLDSLFIIEPIVVDNHLVEFIVSDINRWIEKENIDFDVIFAPAQPAVQTIVSKLSDKTNKRSAFWEYYSTGWFGSKLVSGEIQPGDKVLVFNGVSQQGRCVGERLPSFVQDLGATTVAAAIFAKGTAPGVQDAETRYGNKLYSAIQVDIAVFSPDACMLCSQPNPPALIPWTDLRDKK